MARRTAQELIGSVRGILGEQTPEGYMELLEDITDSVSEVDMSGYVSREDYEKAVADRDAAIAGEKAMRDRYINRFYDGYDAPNDQGFINSSSPQSRIEEDEEDLSYESLFE